MSILTVYARPSAFLHTTRALNSKCPGPYRFNPKPEPTGDPQPKGGRDANPTDRVPEVKESKVFFLSPSSLLGCRWSLDASCLVNFGLSGCIFKGYAFTLCHSAGLHRSCRTKIDQTWHRAIFEMCGGQSRPGAAKKSFSPL